VELRGLETLASCMPWDVQQLIAPLRADPGWVMLLTAVQATKDDGQISVRTILQPGGYITAPPLNPLNAQKTIAHEITESNEGGIGLAQTHAHNADYGCLPKR